MRIIHVTPYFPPNRIGGVGEVVASVHRSLLESGVDSEVVSSGVSRNDPRVHRYGSSPVRFIFSSIAALRTARGADVVHVHHGEGIGLILALRFVRARPRLLLTLHMDNRRLGKSFRPVVVGGERMSDGHKGLSQRLVKAPLKALLDRVALRLCDEVTFVSRAGAGEVLGIPAGEEATVVYNGVEVRFPIAPTNVQRADLIYVGRANLGKRTYLLPHILREVIDARPGTQLRIVGVDQQAVPDLVRTFNRLGVAGSVLWEGTKTSAELARYYPGSSVLLLPSAYEGLPVVILEAMSHGLAVVACDVGGNSEAVKDGSTGLLAPVDNVSAMALACVDLLQGDRWIEFGQAGRERALEEFNLQKQVQQYLKVYQDLAGR